MTNRSAVAIRVLRHCLSNPSQLSIHSYLLTCSLMNLRSTEDGKGRAFNNIFVERLWRSVKYEKVYLKDYSTVAVAIEGLGNYFEFYNHQRLH